MASSKYNHLINRDLSWLKFNERVLEEAEDWENPLFERLNFVSIYQSNLREFLRVRVGSLYDSMLLKKDETMQKWGISTSDLLKAVNKEIKRLMPRQNKALIDILKQLEHYGIYYKTGETLTAYETRFLERYFERNVHPLLSPLIIDKHHPFPFLQNDVVYIAVTLKTKNGNTRLGIIPASGYFERLLLMPSKFIKFTLIENLIYLFAHKVFPKHKVVDKTVFSITRNADIDADEAFFDYDMSYRDIMEITVKKRTRLEPIRLDMVINYSAEIKKVLMKHLNLSSDQVYFNEMPALLSFVSDLRDVLKDEKYAPLFYTKLTPQKPSQIDLSQKLFPQIQKNDLLLSFPYEDVRAFIKLLYEAAEDPKVVSIKITLYRMAHHSQIIDALIRAAENGKEVISVVELRARFDEENNIDWSKRLQQSGVTVIYGIERYKVHSKLLVITRKNGRKLEFITQVGTGNYNESTARLYTDLSLLTSNPEIALNAQDVFQNLCTGTLVEKSEFLLVSPLTLKQTVMHYIDEEIKKARAGQEAWCFFKLNSLSDLDIIRKLIEASNAGVRIDMIVRGICCLDVEATGRTRNIHISSIVGRFLEHSRIYIFGCDKQHVYISSADFMSRNTERRVEVAIPILDEHIRHQLLSLVDVMMHDNVKARHQVGKGLYKKIPPQDDERRINSQIELYKRAYQYAGNPFPSGL